MEQTKGGKGDEFEDFGRFQREILDRGRMIEEFIEDQRKRTPNDRNVVMLQTLFDLLKSELSVNLAIRKTVLEQSLKIKEMEHKLLNIEEKKAQFLVNASDIVGLRFKELNDVFMQIQILKRESDDARKLVSAKDDAVKQKDIEIEQHRALIADLQEENRKLKQQTQNSIQIDNLREDLEESKATVASQAKLISEMVDKINLQKDMREEIQQLRESLAESQKREKILSNQLYSTKQLLLETSNSRDDFVDQGQSGDSPIRPLILVVLTLNRLYGMASLSKTVREEAEMLEEEILALRKEMGEVDLLHLPDA